MFFMLTVKILPSVNHVSDYRMYVCILFFAVRTVKFSIFFAISERIFIFLRLNVSTLIYVLLIFFSR